MMTLKEIRSMFTVGSKWRARRNDDGPGSDETRTVVATTGRYILFARSTASGGDNPRMFTDWPKASEVIEARDGFLRFAYADTGATVTLQAV